MRVGDKNRLFHLWAHLHPKDLKMSKINMKESVSKDLSNHTPMMQQYSTKIINVMI